MYQIISENSPSGRKVLAVSRDEEEASMLAFEFLVVGWDVYIEFVDDIKFMEVA